MIFALLRCRCNRVLSRTNRNLQRIGYRPFASPVLVMGIARFLFPHEGFWNLRSPRLHLVDITDEELKRLSLADMAKSVRSLTLHQGNFKVIVSRSIGGFSRLTSLQLLGNNVPDIDFELKCPSTLTHLSFNSSRPQCRPQYRLPESLIHLDITCSYADSLVHDCLIHLKSVQVFKLTNMIEHDRSMPVYQYRKLIESWPNLRHVELGVRLVRIPLFFGEPFVPPDVTQSVTNGSIPTHPSLTFFSYHPLGLQGHEEGDQSDIALMEWLSKCPKLMHLELIRMDGLSNPVVRGSIAQCRHLTHLEVSDCGGSTDMVDLGCLLPLLSAPLRHLSIQYQQSEWLEELIPKLTHLTNLSTLSFAGQGFATMTRPLPRPIHCLRSFSLDMFTYHTVQYIDAVLIRIHEWFPCLTECVLNSYSMSPEEIRTKKFIRSSYIQSALSVLRR